MAGIDKPYRAVHGDEKKRSRRQTVGGMTVKQREELRKQGDCGNKTVSYGETVDQVMMFGIFEQPLKKRKHSVPGSPS